MVSSAAKHLDEKRIVRRRHTRHLTQVLELLLLPQQKISGGGRGGWGFKRQYPRGTHVAPAFALNRITHKIKQKLLAFHTSTVIALALIDSRRQAIEGVLMVEHVNWFKKSTKQGPFSVCGSNS